MHATVPFSNDRSRDINAHLVRNIPIFQHEGALPKELGELAYAGFELYDDERLGVKLRYERAITKADVYLYDLGLHSVPTNIRSDTVREFFQQACGEVFALGDRGMYLDLEVKASQYLHVPDDAPEPLFLWAAFYYRQAASPFVADEGFRFSHIFLRTDAGYINKVRYTYLERADKDAGEDMIRFLFDWLNSIPTT